MEAFTLTNAHGLEVRAATYGGIIVSLSVPDRDGRVADVVLGHESLEEYIGDSSYFGAIVGRFGNRIAKARFTVDGTTYRLAANHSKVQEVHPSEPCPDRAARKVVKRAQWYTGTPSARRPVPITAFFGFATTELATTYAAASTKSAGVQG